MPKLKVSVVGDFCVMKPDGTRIKFSSRKSEALLAILLFSQDGICSRSKIMSLLWSTRSDKQRRNSLRKELSVLKKSLDQTTLGLVRSDRRDVELDITQVDILDSPIDERTRSTLLDGLNVFDSPAFSKWLHDLRSYQGPNRRAKKEHVEAKEIHSRSSIDIQGRALNPVDFGSNASLNVEILPVTTHTFNAPSFANEIALYNVNRLADSLLRSLFQCDYWNTFDSRASDLGADPMPGHGTHTLSISAYVVERCLEFQIVLKDPSNLTIWVNPKFSCDVVSQKVFRYFDDVCATLPEFLLTYAQGIRNGQKWENEFQLSQILDGLFVPGSKPISEINIAISNLVRFEPTAINISLRNCARMLQFGERLDGYDCVTKELVGHDLRRALELAPGSALTHSVASHAFSMFLGNNIKAIEHAQRSVELQPQNEIYLAFLALALLRDNRIKEAINWMSRAHALPGNPKYKPFMDAVFCACLTTAGEFDRATTIGERALNSNPKFNATKKYLFASYAQLGYYQKAQRLADEIKTFDNAFGRSGILSAESPVNIKPAVPVLAKATKLVGIF